MEVEIDYKSAYEDLNSRLKEFCDRSSALCDKDKETRPFCAVFDNLRGVGDGVLINHIKEK